MSPACTGYVAGKQAPEYKWHGEDAFFMPTEFVRAFFVYTARERVESTELFLRVIYGEGEVYVRALLEKLGTDYETFLTEMNDTAKKLGMVHTSFSSLTGNREEEAALRSALGFPEVDFSGSKSCLDDCFIFCRALASDAGMIKIFGEYTTKFPESSAQKTRNEPLLRPSSEFYIEDAVVSLGGWGVTGGRNPYILISAVRNGESMGYSAVSSYTGDKDALSYAACDSGNLSGKAVGKDYQLNYLPSSATSGTGMVIGGSIFSGGILIVFGLALIFLILTAAVGIVVRFKRNVEGRKKYTTPKKQ